MGDTVWVVGKYCGEMPVTSAAAWSFMGVFTSEEAAREHAKISDFCFVAAAKLNEALPLKDILWPGAYYPAMEERPKA